MTTVPLSPRPATRMPPAAAVSWGEDGVLRSTAFGDVYASREGALAEARAVFLDGCDLPERWRGRRRFAIAELGFGTGLNALAAWELWRRTRPPDAVLHYVSIEGFPLPQADAARALAPFPDIAPLAARLLAQWPVRAYGPQRFVFADDGFILTVLHEEAQSALDGLEHRFDAWFLDGFAPARNPAMWSETILSRLASLCAPGARLATYSAAGAVRRGLEAAGFTVWKTPGFAAKRERLIAEAPGVAVPDPKVPNRIAVVGGGIAGACLAHALRRRGAVVTLISAGAALADQASGNPAGLVMPRLDRGEGPGPAFLRAAFLAAIALYRRETPDAFHPCGVLQRPDSPRAAEAFADLLSDPPWPDTHLLAGEDAGLRHAAAGMLNPRAAVAALAAQVPVILNAPVAGLQRSRDGWRLLDQTGETLHEAQAVVLAAGAHIRDFAVTAWLPIALSAGQIEIAPAPGRESAVTQGAYVGPAGGGVVFGATFEPTPHATAAVSLAARRENWAKLAALDPALAAALDETALQSRAAVRATTTDRLPFAGPAPNAAAWTGTDLASGPRLPGLWLLGGLGARGLTLSPLLAESLASRLLAEPDPLPAAWAAALDPARFLVRAVKRGERLDG